MPTWSVEVSMQGVRWKFHLPAWSPNMLRSIKKNGRKMYQRASSSTGELMFPNVDRQWRHNTVAFCDVEIDMAACDDSPSLMEDFLRKEREASLIEHYDALDLYPPPVDDPSRSCESESHVQEFTYNAYECVSLAVASDDETTAFNSFDQRVHNFLHGRCSHELAC